jgi:hypothetical protein
LRAGVGVAEHHRIKGDGMARNPWLRLGLNTWALGMEASQVIALRMLKILSGGSAGQDEARRMVDEKIQAAMDLQSAALRGSLGQTAEGAAGKVVSHYRRRVRANRRRLARE